MPTPPPQARMSIIPPEFWRAVKIMTIVVALLWALEVVDVLTNHALDQFGIAPRSVASLPTLVSAPFLHFGWGHLISNTVPLFVLGVIIAASGVAEFAWASALSALVSGVLVWTISPTGTITLGASGIIFGYLTYVLLRGFYTRKWSQLFIALIVGLSYGSVLWGVLPLAYGVSWQAHLGGALGGVLAVIWLHQRPRQAIPARR